MSGALARPLLQDDYPSPPPARSATSYEEACGASRQYDGPPRATAPPGFGAASPETQYSASPLMQSDGGLEESTARKGRSVSKGRSVWYDPASPAIMHLESHDSLEEGQPSYRRFRSRSPVGGRHHPPLQRRTSSKNGFLAYPLIPGPAGELRQFHVQRTQCKGCNSLLEPEEVWHQTGFCDKCYNDMHKECCICKRTLLLKNLQQQTSLCSGCYERCTKDCKQCGNSLETEQLHWDTGLCDKCWDLSKADRACRMCLKMRGAQEINHETGLCDECYDGVEKFCRMCNEQIEKEGLKYGSGMCDNCYEKYGKKCSKCKQDLHLGDAHWRSRMCEHCFQTCDKVCNKCHNAIDVKSQEIWAVNRLCNDCHGKLKQGKCEKCNADVKGLAKLSGTGLCDTCYDALKKRCKNCDKHMRFGDMRWGSGLCNECYDKATKICKGTGCEKRIPLGAPFWSSALCNECYQKAEKVCTGCQEGIPLGSLHWGTGLCDKCHDRAEAAPQRSPSRRGLGRGVWAVIMAQFVFYAAPGMLTPSLYLQVEREDYPPSPAAAFAMVLMSASFAAMLAPVPLGCWADRRGEREVYCGMAILGVVSSLALLCALPVPCFAFAWACINLPPAIRGVRAAYFAKNVDPDDLSRAGNFASAFGLLGGFLGPLTSVLVNAALGGRATRWLNCFTAGAGIAAAIFALCLLHVVTSLAARKQVAKRKRRADGTARPTSRSCERCDKSLPEQLHNIVSPFCDECFSHRCERCNELFDESQLEKQLTNETALCDRCYDHFGGNNKSFKHFRKEVLVSFCGISMLLELGMNAAVIATFQPLAVAKFGWGNNAIAAVNFGGAGLSVFISMSMAWLRMPERTQMGLAAALYLSGVAIYACPPLSEWRLVLGLMLGIKAQILFMAPFTAIFSRLIGGVRFTNTLSTCLVLAPSIGAAIGTALAPIFVSVAGTAPALLAVVPSLLAVALILGRWQWLSQGQVKRPCPS